MSKFDELKKAAEAATPGPWVLCKYGSVMADATNCEIVPAETGMSDNLFIATANPVAILELLAIQAQLVEALESVFKIQIENYGDGISTHINLAALTTKVQDAIFVARSQP